MTTSKRKGDRKLWKTTYLLDMLYNNRLGTDVLSTSLKPAIADRLLLRLHDAAIIGRGQQALQPHGLVVVNVRAYYTDSHVFVHGIIAILSSFRQEI